MTILAMGILEIEETQEMGLEFKCAARLMIFAACAVAAEGRTQMRQELCRMIRNGSTFSILEDLPAVEALRTIHTNRD